MSPEPRDTDLVALALAGDKGAFGDLLTRHRRLALWLAARLLGEAAEAEDVTQDACVQAYLGLARLRDPARFGPWLAGIALNLARMRLRGRRATVTLEALDGGRVIAGAAHALTPEAEAEARELIQRVRAALAALPAPLRAAVRMYYLDGLTLEAIGQAAGAPVGTVKARLHRARRQLRARLNDSGPPTQKERMMIEVTVESVLMRTHGLEAHEVVFLTTWGEAGDVVESASRVPPPPGAEPAQFELPIAPPLAPRVIVLREQAGERRLPIWVGPPEADAIVLHLAGEQLPRPMTFDLTARLLAVAGATLTRVVINRLHEEVFYAVLHVTAGGAIHEVDARPSDAINLALRTGAPLFVAPEVMDAQGVAPEHLSEKLERQMQPPPPVRWVAAPPPIVKRPRPPQP